jgi:hypothetical protein
MTGTWLRGPTMPEPSVPHTCQPPKDSSIGRGAIWRCPCRRRWKVVNRIPTVAAGNGTLGRPARPVWRRRRLPWPRRTPEERAEKSWQAEQRAVSRRGGVYTSGPGVETLPGIPPPTPALDVRDSDNIARLMDYDG